MKISTDRLIGLFSIFFTAALPLFSGLVASNCQPILVETLGLAKGAASDPFTLFVFNHFGLLLWCLWGMTVLLVAAGVIFYFRQKDPVLRTGQMVMLTVMSAVISVVFLALFLFAATISFQKQMLLL